MLADKPTGLSRIKLKPLNYRGPGGDRTLDLQTEATPPAASCPARTLHATEIAPKKRNSNDMPVAALDNWQPVWNAQVSISTHVCISFELRSGAGDIHICWFNFDALAQGNAYKHTKEPINYRGPGGDRTHDLQTEATPPAASCPARALHATEIAPKKRNSNDMPVAALDNWQPVWNAQVSISTPACVNFDQKVSETQSSADWMPADKPTELSRIKLINLNSTARPYDQQAFSPPDPTAIWHSHLALAIYIFVVVNFDALAQASDIQIERRQVVFLCWMQDSNPEGLWNPIFSRLNACWQTDWAIEDQA